jgi:hypothetical protein
MVAVVVGGCGDDGAADGVEDGDDACARQTSRFGGQAPSCTVGWECTDGVDTYSMECDGDGTGECACLENDAEVTRVPYEDRFCPATFEEGTENNRAYVEIAAEVCDWPLPTTPGD